jgi:hypothetical protein
MKARHGLSGIWGTRESRLNQAALFYGRKIVMVLDGVEQQTVMSTTKSIAKQTRSGKKTYHTLSKLVGVSPNMKLMLFSNTYIPHNDLILCRMPEVISKLKELRKPEAIGGDPAFYGLEDDLEIEVIVPYKEYPGHPLSENEEKYNNEWKEIRIYVENYFAEVKDFKILRITFRCKGNNLEQICESHHRVWVVCAWLVDKYIHPNGKKLKKHQRTDYDVSEMVEMNKHTLILSQIS